MPIIKEVPVKVPVEVVQQVTIPGKQEIKHVEVTRDVPIVQTEVKTIEKTVELKVQCPPEIHTVEVVREKPIPTEIVEREVMKPVEVRVDVPIVKHCPVVTETITREVLKEVPVEVVREKIVEVPKVHKVTVIKEVLKEVHKHIKVEVVREKIVEVPVNQPVEVRVEVPMPTPVVHETMRTQCVPVIKEVIKEVEVTKEVPVEVVHEHLVALPLLKVVEIGDEPRPPLIEAGQRGHCAGRGPMEAPREPPPLVARMLVCDDPAGAGRHLASRPATAGAPVHRPPPWVAHPPHY